MAGRKSKYNTDYTIQDNVWRFAIYMRLSFDDGEDDIESNSITNQRELIKMFLEREENINIIDYYIDDGYSGTDFNRPGFKKLLKDVIEGKVNAIIVKDLSRFGRNYIEVGNYIEQIFPLYGIRFIAINDNVDSYKDPKSVDNAIVPFKNLMNDEYCRDISNKVKSVLNAKKKNGEFCGGMTPYGYSRDPEDKHHFVINQDEAKIIKMIFNKALEGKGRTTIAMELNDSNILSIREIRRRERLAKKGIECDNNLKYYWAGTHVYEILKNEMYCGDMIQCRFKSISYKNHKIVRVPEDEWIIVRNTHEAIIDRETFDKVQKILDKRKNTNPKKGKKSIFAGFMKCYDCKQKMVKKSSYKRADGYQVYNYYCSLNTLKSYKLCSKHKIRNDDLEKAVLESINLQISLVIDLEKTIQEVKKKKKNEINSDLLRKQIKQKEGEYNKIRKLKKSVYEDWKLEIISREDFEMYSRDYEQRTSNIELELKILKDKMKEEQEGKYIDDKWIDIFMKNQNLDKLTRNVLEELIECIYVHEDGKITIDFKYQDEYNQALKFIKS